MSQHDYVIDNQNGAAFRADLNAALQAIVSDNAGPSAPLVTFAFMRWADTLNNQLKIRDDSNTTWVVAGALGEEYLGAQPYDADIATVAASQIEMEGRTEAALRSMSPLRVGQAISASPTFRAVASYSSAVTLTSSAYRTFNYVSGTFTITLPIAATADIGKTITFYASTTASVSFNTQSSQIIYARGTTPSLPVLLITTGDSITITCHSSGGFMVTSASSSSGIGEAQTYQTVTRTAGTTYYNTTGKPILWHVNILQAGNATVTIGGYTHPPVFSVINVQTTTTYIVPDGKAYSYTTTGGTIAHQELR